MTQPDLPKDRIRDAATVVLIRRDGPAPRVLMGQRGKGAAFMPSKFVFPGGAVDPEDGAIPAARPLPEDSARRLAERADPGLVNALAMAAIRELWEETGLALSAPAGTRPEALSPDWQSFYDAGHFPAADALRFFFRAVTPPGRPRRFDARFFLADAERLAGPPDDFSRAGSELGHLSWLTLDEARHLDLPFITEVVLAEIATRLAAPVGDEHAVPFVHHEGGRSLVDPL